MSEANAGDGCLLCAIIEGREPGSFAYQDDDVVAFMDLRPVTPGHLMVVPRRHASGLADLDDASGVAVWRVATRLAAALRASGLRCDGVNLFLADGEAAFQEVFHVHLHVIPRYPGDGFQLSADWKPADRADLDANADAISAALSKEA
jgi:histidine triad (HIT) family protein